MIGDPHSSDPTSPRRPERCSVKRAEASRKANTKDAAKLLAAYNEHASAIGDILDELDSLDIEREAINAELRTNPVAETVASYTDIHRKAPDRQASERHEMRPCWVFTIRHAENLTGKWSYYDEEVVRPATLDENGKPVPTASRLLKKSLVFRMPS